MSSASYSGKECPLVLCMAWNSDGSALALGTATFLSIYSSEKTLVQKTSLIGEEMSEGEGNKVHGLLLLAKREMPGGVGQISMFGQSSLLLFSGSTLQQRCKVTLWDDSKGIGLDGVTLRDECTLAQVTLSNPVRGLRFHTHLLLVAEDFKVHVFDSRLQRLDSLPTPTQGNNSDNNCNTIAMATITHRENFGAFSGSILRFAMLGPTVGSIRCISYTHAIVPSRLQGTAESQLLLRNQQKLNIRIAHPHERRVKCIAMNTDGSIAVTVSDNGTALKVIDVVTGDILKQVSRGTTPSMVNTISVNSDASLVACVSESGTVHCFSVKRGEGTTTPAPSAFQWVVGVVGSIPSLNPAAQAIVSDRAFATLPILSSIADEKMAIMSSNASSSAAEGAEAFDMTTIPDNTSAYSGLFSTIVLRPGLDRSGCATALVTIGSLYPNVKAKCILIQIDEKKNECRRLATFLVPRDEL